MKKLMRKLAAGAALMLAAAAPGQAHAAYPERPIRMIMPFSAGGPTDTMARLVAENLGKRLDQVITVINKPGADNLIAAREVTGSAADGYTLLFTTNGLLSVAPSVNPQFPLNPQKDFTYIGSISGYPYIFVTSADDKRSTLQSFIDESRQKAESVSYAVVGNVSAVAGALFTDSLGIKMLPVRYKGNADTVTDIFSGRVDLGVFAPSFSLALMESGKLKPLAVTGTQRLTQLPDLPLAHEVDPKLKHFSESAVVWTAVVAPAGLPEPIREKLEGLLESVVNDPAFIEQVNRLGDRVMWRTGPDTLKRATLERETWTRVVKDTGLTIQ